MMNDRHVIIVAGGSGVRMGTVIPKQFLILNGKPILMHTIEKFKNYDIVLVLPDQYRSMWENLCNTFAFEIKHKVVSGGKTRFESVCNGLDSINSQEGLVAIHDGVRPLVSQQVIEESFEAASVHGSAVPCVKVHETVRKLSTKGNKTIKRDNLRLIQTPQTFNLRLLKEAYSNAPHHRFTDDAGVFESAGHDIFLFDGNAENIKITLPCDLKYASVLV